MTYEEATALLRAAGLAFERRPFGIGAALPGPDGTFRLQIGRASAGGDELSVKPPVGLVRWFRRPTLHELVGLVVEAQHRVQDGRSRTLLDALLELDPR